MSNTRRYRKPTATGKLVQLYREQRGLSQVALGRKLPCASSYVSRIELGDRHLQKRETIDAICAALNLGPEQRDRLLVAAGHTPPWVTDITVRQLVFLLRSLPTHQERKLRHLIRRLTAETCGG